MLHKELRKQNCKRVTMEDWKRRAMGERVLAALGVLLEHQQ
jgi:hypothetical protein